jgi:hypothetical protein
VLDESQFSEFVHEEIDARTRCANHLSEHFLRNFVENGAGLVLLAVAPAAEECEPVVFRWS